MDRPAEQKPLIHWVLFTVVMSAVYYLFGSLGQMLAIPPGQVTLIWPPSGIALAAYILYGRMSLPGIFIGAFASNYHFSADIQAQVIISTIIIAIGSCLQPQVGYLLLRRLSGPADILINRQTIGTFALSAVVMTTVSSSIGATGLYSMDMAPAGFIRTMAIWWGGDFMGVLFFTPLVLTLFRKSYSSHENRFLALTLIMAGISIILTAVTILLTYTTYMNGQRVRLAEIAQSQASLIESVARFDVQYSEGDVAGGAEAATLSQVSQAFGNTDVFESSGQYMLAKREGDNIVFILNHTPAGLAELPEPVPFDNVLAHPMYRALSGESGIMIGRDYQGADVLAAYEYIPVIELGLVVKTDLAEIRRPFLNAVAIVTLLAVFLIVLAVQWFHRISAPLLESLQRKSKELQVLVEEQTLELRESENQFRSLLDSAPEAMLIVDASGRIELTNSMMSALSGYENEELLGEEVEILIPERYRHVHQGLRNTFLESPGALRIDESKELYLLKKDGHEIRVSISLNPIKTGKGFVIAAAIRDITREKQFEQSLKDNEARLTLALESGGMEVYEVDLKRKVILSNYYLYQKFGYSPDQETSTRIETDPWMKIIHPDDRQWVLDTVNKYIEGKSREYRIEYRVLTRDGDIKWIETNGMVTERFEDGKPSKMVGVRHDISVLKVSEMELHEKLQELETFNKLAIGRELQMIELKQEINAHRKQLGMEEKFEIVE